MQDKSCPICKKSNNCEVKNSMCWCFEIKVPKELIALLPKFRENKTCICKNCILEFKENKEKFIHKYNLI